LRTNVSDQCKASMIALHGQEKWDRAVEQQAAIDGAGGVAQSRALTPEEAALATGRGSKAARRSAPVWPRSCCSVWC
jgi:hypothetical protein